MRQHQTHIFHFLKSMSAYCLSSGFEFCNHIDVITLNAVAQLTPSSWRKKQ